MVVALRRATRLRFGSRSAVELPDAAPQPWIVSKPGTPAGRIEKQTIKSAIQKLERGLIIYTPAGYKSDGPPNPLLVLFDGDDILSDDFLNRVAALEQKNLALETLRKLLNDQIRSSERTRPPTREPARPARVSSARPAPSGRLSKDCLGRTSASPV